MRATTAWMLTLLVAFVAAVGSRGYPSQFRREYGREMMLAFKDRVRDRLRHDRVSAVVPLMLHVVSDWIATVVRERADALAPCTLQLADDPVLPIANIDDSTQPVSLAVAILGACLLIIGWYRWAHLMTTFGR